MQKKKCNCPPGKRVCERRPAPGDDPVIDGVRAVDAMIRTRKKTLQVDQLLSDKGLPAGMTKAFMKDLCPICTSKKNLEVCDQTETLADAALDAAGLSTTN